MIRTHLDTLDRRISMRSNINLSETVQKMLICPNCRTNLELCDKHLKCKNQECNFLFPMLNHIPILINENNSVFAINDFMAENNSTFFISESKLEQVVTHLAPTITRNTKGRKNCKKLAKLLLCTSNTPKVLVIGGNILGEGMEALIKHSEIELVDSDVSFGPRTKLVCDAHNIPFEDKSFDGVIVQGVLEYVVDPSQCVEEIHRVLKEDGIIYAETPFMQQVHGGRYDFTRFTHLGHRRLFRKFEEIESGAICGPATALIWSYRYFLLSFTTSSFLRKLF